MRQDPAVRWLLASDDPSVRYLMMVDLLDEPLSFDEVREARQRLPERPRVKALLAGQQADGGFGVGPYQKWRGAHWRLISLVELGVDGGDPRAVAAAHQVLDWLCGDSHRRRIWKIGGLTRAHASQEGNALAVFSRLGMAGEPRVAAMADSLVEWQWPDGGWNCSGKEDARHSSFYESLAPLWGLVEYQRAVGGQRYAGAVDRASELFLRHRLFRSERTGEVINPEWQAPLSPLLALRRAAGPPGAGPRGQARRPKSAGGAGLYRGEAPSRRQVEVGRVLLEAARQQRLQRGGGRLGEEETQRDDNAERPAGTEGGRKDRLLEEARLGRG